MGTSLFLPIFPSVRRGSIFRANSSLPVVPLCPPRSIVLVPARRKAERSSCASPSPASFPYPSLNFLVHGFFLVYSFPLRLPARFIRNLRTRWLADLRRCAFSAPVASSVLSLPLFSTPPAPFTYFEHGFLPGLSQMRGSPSAYASTAEQQ